MKVIAWYKDGEFREHKISPVVAETFHGPFDAIELVKKEWPKEYLEGIDRWEVEDDFL